MTSLLHSIAETLVIISLGASALFGFNAPAQGLGGVQVAADFSSSLVSGISSTATTMTLVSTSTPSGEHLVQGKTYGFKLGGREYVVGTLSAGRQITGMTRGLSLITGTTTAGVAEAWGRGTAVEITDAPILLQLAQQTSGLQGFDVPIYYESSVSTSSIAVDPRNLVSVQLLNDTAFAGAGIVNATTGLKGVVEIATGGEAAASTANGNQALLVIPSSIATSSHNSTSSATNVIPVTNSFGVIDDFFLPHNWTKNFNISTTSKIGNQPITKHGMNVVVASSTGVGTLTIPNGVQWLEMEGVAGGASGGNCASGGSPAGLDMGGGGGSGGYFYKVVDVSGTTSVGYFVGAAGQNTFVSSYASSTAGSQPGEGPGGVGGQGFGGDLNAAGGPGGTAGTERSGAGGTSHFGGGAQGLSSGNSNGSASGNYGAGGSGATCSSSNQTFNGGAGSQGVIKFRY